MRGLFGLGMLAASLYCVRAQPFPALESRYWLPDGPVNALLATNGVLYFGGDFSYVGPRTGPVGLFDLASGQLLGSPPLISGVVRAVVSDGEGGWFIGGVFTRVGNVAVTNLAHLNSDLSLDIGWRANVVGTTINALALDGGVLYIGGTFQRVGGVQVSGLAGLDRDKATVTWNPSVGGSVNAIKIANGLLYAGGTFYSVGSSNRQNLAAIALTTGLANGWDPQADQQVYALEIADTAVYVGGQFTQVGTKPRKGLAALDTTTGVSTTWNPNPNGIVRAIAVAGTSVYVGGDFTAIGGQNRRGFGVVNKGNGAAQSFDLAIQVSGNPIGLVRAILLNGTSVYVGGSLTNAMGETHRLIAGFNGSTGQSIPTPAGSDFNGATYASFGINAMAAANGAVFVAGEFQSIGGVPRQRAAALSLASGTVLPWAPEFDKPVLSLAAITDRIYVGGNFTNVSGNFVRGLAAVDSDLGDVISSFAFLGTNQFADVSVTSLAVSGNRVYVGGAFVAVADKARRFLAAVDPDTGTPVPQFDAKLGGGYYGVTTLLLAGDNLYVGGDFTSANSQPTARLAAVAPDSGALRSWTPNPNQQVNTLAAAGDTLYVGGTFNQIGGVAFKNFAAFSLSDFSLQGVDAALGTFAYGVTAIAATPTVLYVGGSFDSIGGEFRLNLASLASFNASSYEWDAAPDQPPSAIALTDDLAIIGGSYRTLGRSPTNVPSGFLSVFSRAPKVSGISATANRTVKILTTTGDRTDAVLQASPNMGNPVWTSVATNDAPGFSWTAEVPATSPSQFYRVIAR